MHCLYKKLQTVGTDEKTDSSTDDVSSLRAITPGEKVGPGTGSCAECLIFLLLDAES